jgi:hypothetical protein
MQGYANWLILLRTMQYLLTYLLSWALLEKLPIVQPFREFPAILRKPKVHHRVRKSPPLVPILSQFDPVHTIPSYLSKIHLILSTHLRLGLPSGLFHSGSSSATVLSDPALYILLTFHVPNLKSIFLRLGPLSKKSVHVRGFLWIFVTILFTARSF